MTDLLMKRLFVGIKIHPNKKLLDFYSKLKTSLKDDKIKWVPAENFHITLKFLGETPTSLLPKITKSLEQIVADFEIFSIKLKGLGHFKKQQNTKVIWLGLENVEILSVMAEKIDIAMQKLGFEPETRPFKAHLTLGRVKYISNEIRIQEQIKAFNDFDIQLVRVSSVVLFESVLKKNGPQYYSFHVIDL
jgi:RNA 2',3'-cyclic 3'-phosphodiesterase